jgi:hypothetical protein
MVLAELVPSAHPDGWVIGRQSEPPYWEFWTPTGWCGAGVLWTDKPTAEAIVALINQQSVEIERLREALETIQRVDEHRMWVQDYIRSPTPEELAKKALAGHKTLGQLRWEWQGKTICNWKERAEALETSIDQHIFDLNHRQQHALTVEEWGRQLGLEKARIIARFDKQTAADCKAFTDAQIEQRQPR